MIVDKLNDILNRNEHGSTVYMISLFMKSHIQEIEHMTVDETAKACFVSKGQISKYVRLLGFEHWIEFKKACEDYCSSRKDRSNVFSPYKTLEENSRQFMEGLIRAVRYTQACLDHGRLEQIIQDISKSNTVYLYGRGDTRVLCNIMQVEFSTCFKNVLICDADFEKEYHFNQDDLLIFLSINGRSFRYAKKEIDRLEKSKVSRWLVTCQRTLKFSGNRLIVPTKDIVYNEYIMRYVIDLILAGCRQIYE